MLESNSFPKGQKGFGLTEVIVSMLVLGIAVIGLRPYKYVHWIPRVMRCFVLKPWLLLKI